MNTTLLFVSLMALLVIGKSDHYENYDKMMQKKEELKPFYDALMDPGLCENGGDNDKLNKLMDFMDDEFELCSQDQIGKGPKCKNKKEFRDEMKEKRDDGVYYGYKIDIDSMNDDDNYVSVKCEFMFVDEKTGCRTTNKQMDDFYYTKDGKIKLLEVKYEGSSKRCPGDSNEYNDKPSTTEDEYRFRRENGPNYQPSTTRNQYVEHPPNKDDIYAEYERNTDKKDREGKDREGKLRDFYKTILECGLKKNEDIDGMMDKVMDYFDDDVEFCSPDGDNMNAENKQCYHGKDAVKNMMRRTFNGKYESIDHSTSIKKNEEKYVEVECKSSYKDEDGCVISLTETDGIHYGSNGKIKIFNVRDAVATPDPEKCGGNDDKSKYYVNPSGKPSTTEDKYEPDKESQTDKPSTTKHRPQYERMREEKRNTNKPSTTKEAPQYRAGREDEQTEDASNKKDRDDKLRDFYKTALECGLKKNEDIDGMMDKMMDYFNDNVEFCSPDGDNMNDENKQCYHGKDAVKDVMKRTFNRKYKAIDYSLNFKKNEEKYVEVDLKCSFQDENGCIIELTETDKIYYDSYGKIEVFDSKDAVATPDPEKCGGYKDASKSKENRNYVYPSTTKEAPEHSYYNFRREDTSYTDKPTTTKIQYMRHAPNNDDIYAEYERMREQERKTKKPSTTERYNEDASNDKNRVEKLKDFYKSAVECGLKENKDIDGIIDKLMDEVSDNIRLCTPEGGENKECYHGKEEVRNELENIIDCQYKMVDHKFKITKNEKHLIRVEIENKFRDGSECILYHKETVDIYYNNGKIVIYDVVDSVFDLKECDYDDMKSPNE